MAYRDSGRCGRGGVRASGVFGKGLVCISRPCLGSARSFVFTRNSPVLTDAAFVPAPANDSAQISQLIGVASDLSVHSMGDKSPKSKNKQATQKQTKAEVESQKKKTPLALSRA